MIQVARLGSGFTVLVDGVADGTFTDRQSAIRHALAIRENHDITSNRNID